MIEGLLFRGVCKLSAALQRRWFSNRNILTLSERGFIQSVFPENTEKKISNVLNGSPQTIYAGFDPTADSLHVGNLLVLIGLLHSQRAGHQAIALLGGATGLVGDPSGRSTERVALEQTTVSSNNENIRQQIESIFKNHLELFWEKKGLTDTLKTLKFVDNAEWYSNLKLIEFISESARFMRMGTMLSRASVQSRLKSEAGMSYAEFTYQALQAYDWLHLYKNHHCKFQLGGNDQMGNIMSGQELVSKVENKQVYGLTVPLVTTEEGDKFGKSAGNAVWLHADKTSPFGLYQFFIRVADSQIEKLLKLFTFLTVPEIDTIMEEHRRIPELRTAQKTLAKEVCLLVHGEHGLEKAEAITAALYTGSTEVLATLPHRDIEQIFLGATTCEILPEPGMNVLDLAMKARCFPTKNDAIRIITAGGFYINQQRAQDIAEILSPTVHILQNGITILRVGKKNYYVIKWLL